ncbi:CGP-CTERM-anchored Cys-rich protein [Pyrococcus kukulkanii]|uniref:CGP-CTERM-anchored Cys-rich protein n=1 Tax=Pyrococcus kukulkanii TaxID=1609559 RepID=UPI003563918F
MRKVIPLILLLLFVPLAEACIFPQDFYAVEVELNKGSYDLSPLLNAKNVVEYEGKIIYKSHYDPRLIVILWSGEWGVGIKENGSYLHIRIQIPTKRVKRVRYSEEFQGIIPVEETKERAKNLGWEVGEYSLVKDNITIILTKLKGFECKDDSDCKVAGCSKELCVSKNESPYSICVYRKWYVCLNLTKCGCYNGFCTWLPNEEFLRCLKEHNITIDQIIKAKVAKVNIIIEVRGNLTKEKIREIRDVLGDNVPINFTERWEWRVMPSVDPRTINASEAMKTELKWLKSAGVIKISDSDIEEITSVAKWGYAGYNARIGFYDGKWIPYLNASNAVLIKCGGLAYEEYPIPASTPVLPSSGRICGPGLILLLAILIRGRRK